MSQTNSSSIRNIDQVRAGDALRRIELLSREDRENYESEAKRLPIRIMASGLGQAMAFINAKAKRTGLERLHDDLSEWVLQERATKIFGDAIVKTVSKAAEKGKSKPSLLHSIIEGDSEFLRWATAETLAFLVWLNRFAEGKRVEAELAELHGQSKGD